MKYKSSKKLLLLMSLQEFVYIFKISPSAMKAFDNIQDVAFGLPLYIANIWKSLLPQSFQYFDGFWQDFAPNFPNFDIHVFLFISIVYFWVGANYAYIKFWIFSNLFTYYISYDRPKMLYSGSSLTLSIYLPYKFYIFRNMMTR